MDLTPTCFLSRRQCYLPLLDPLRDLFQDMDESYDTVAGKYGFVCTGCTENCCLTRFHHHTLLEYLYLMEGIRKLGMEDRQAIRQRALTADRQLTDADRKGRALRVMCPLNVDGRCRLYPHRPMICRLHGIPHELHPPNRRIVRNPGCDAFFDQCRARGKTDYIPFDRTPFYRRMATLERQLRQATGYEGKIKLTVARMVISITDPDHEIDRP